jgi:hypothetical protein
MLPAHGRQRIHQHEPLQSRTVSDRIQDHRQLAWLLCATTSLLTTRHLLVEGNLHYPLQLYSCQIVATAIFAFLSRLWRRTGQERSDQEQPRKQPIQASLSVAASQCLQAVAALCITQAVLHTSNLPLLCMMAVSLFRLAAMRIMLI